MVTPLNLRANVLFEFERIAKGTLNMNLAVHDLNKSCTIREDSHKKSVFLVVGPLKGVG